jgi:hypothetical protein
VKTNCIRLLVLLALVTISSASLLAQGSLTPPGVPAPTMKTLDQIEPRTPISSAPYTISAAGSYYLTGNLTVSSGDAIIIAADNVSFDLNGFTILSTYANGDGSGHGVNVTGGTSAAPRRNIEIRDGFIKSGVTFSPPNNYSVNNSGFHNGINAPSSFNVRVRGISISGCRDNAISLDQNSTIECCTARVGLFGGFFATVIRDSVAAQYGATAINGFTVENCRGDCTGSNPGVLGSSSVVNSYGASRLGTALSGGVVSGCIGLGQSGRGISGDSVNNSYGTSSTGIGVDAKAITGTYGLSTSNFGINADTVQSCYGVSGSSPGIKTRMASNSYASSGSGIGLDADSTLNCYGTSSTGQYGLDAITAQNSYGDGQGLHATTATNCYGAGTLTGISASVATNCYGTATAGAGLSVTGLATNCFGNSDGSGAGITCNHIIFGCFGTSNSGTGLSAVTATSSWGSSISVTNRHEMP